MLSAGIRELRDRLSEYIDRVEEGETIRVTKYDREVARITPAEDTLPEELSEMLNEEGISWSGRTPKGSKNPVSLTGSPASDSVLENRR